ncbi:hypothetical protein OG456_44650 [Streptomyces sp. NBC_01446]|uniref:Uncharacterized protein n=1 Tax=Streptomyces sp. NBC_00119 TaxID=2975659 RepID=A0AAU1ULY9_9ACTN|nr:MULTISPECIES: hypothetical protein [unclassified Streptomyces]MCX4649299.1 hypothetical protein [Streptomyces sp. NBC_01446]MCX5321489.1 hypothetical protein [Streptomyces sp. NBC_00120]
MSQIAPARSRKIRVRAEKTSVSGWGTDWTGSPTTAAPAARPTLVPTAVTVVPACGGGGCLAGEKSTSPAASPLMAVPVATPCTARAITRDRTPSAVQKIAVLAAAGRSAASGTGRRPRRSLVAPRVRRAPSSPTTYTAKTTVTVVTEKSQRSR